MLARADLAQDDLADDDDQEAEGVTQKYVNLFVAPGLLRRDNPDGGGYDHTTYMVRILVTCRWRGTVSIVDQQLRMFF